MTSKVQEIQEGLVRHPASFLRPWLKLAVALSALAIALVVFKAYRESQEESAWTALARARQDGMSIAALEAARNEGRGSSAQPWIDFHLAFALFDEGGVANLGRAREVATVSLEEHPRHTVAQYLRSLLDAIDSFRAESA